MHFSALFYCERFVYEHLSGYLGKPCRILDVGSLDINGTLRAHFTGPGKELWQYTGVDLVPGKGVDVVVKQHVPFPFEDGSFDVIVSASCLTHDHVFWVTFANMARLLSSGGYMYINVPSNGDGYMPYPIDCWRWKDDAWYGLQSWSRRIQPNVNIRCVQHFVGNMLNNEMWLDNVSIWKRDPKAWCTDCPYARLNGEA